MYLFCVQQILADYTTSTETPAGLDRPDLKRPAPNPLQTSHTRIFPFVNATWTGSRLLSGTRHRRTGNDPRKKKVCTRTQTVWAGSPHKHQPQSNSSSFIFRKQRCCSTSASCVGLPVFNLPAPLLTRAARICAAPHPNRAPDNATPHRGQQLSRALTSPGRGSNQYAEGI